MMLTPRNTSAVFALLIAIFLATSSETYAEPLCSDYNEKSRTCRKSGCVYVKFKSKDNICVHEPTEDQCSTMDKRSACKRMGCKWYRPSKTCLLPTGNDDSENRSADIIIDDDRNPDVELDPWVNDRVPPQNPGNRDDNSQFWAELIGMDKDDAISEIDDEFDSFYNVFICGKPDSDHQCLMRNVDPKRVKLETDDNNLVTRSTVG